MVTSLSTDTIKRARKAHLCNWCKEPIDIGTSYVRQRNVDGKEAWTWRAHVECDKASNRLSADDLENLRRGVTFTRGCTCERSELHGDWCDEELNARYDQ